MEHCSEGSQRLKLLFARLAWRLCPWCMIASTISMAEMTSDVDRASHPLGFTRGYACQLVDGAIRSLPFLLSFLPWA